MNVDSQAPVNAIHTSARYGLEFAIGDTVSYTSIQGRTSYGEVVSILRNYDPIDASRIKYEVKLEGSAHTNIYYPRELHIDPLCALRKLNAAYLAWETAWLANTDKDLIARLSAEHDRLFDAHMAAIGAPPKSMTQAPATANTTRVIFAADGYDMDDAAEIAFEADDFLGPVSQPAPVATPPQPAPAMGLQHGQQRTGRVSCYDSKNDYGYIASGANSFYFRKSNLAHAAMPIKGGDTVTFEVWQASADAQPKATRITKPGYVAPVSTAQEFERRHAETRKASEERCKAIRAERLAKRQRGA